MLDDDTNRPLLDFSDMVNAVNSFQQKFKAYTEHAITTISDEKVDFDSGRVQHNNQLQTIDREIEDAKSSQRQLWDSESGTYRKHSSILQKDHIVSLFLSFLVPIYQQSARRGRQTHRFDPESKH